MSSAWHGWLGSRVLLGFIAVVACGDAARAGHEVSYYPSFYPQEIRIEPLDPAAAAREFSSRTDPLHVYVGGAPDFGGEVPAHLKSTLSLRSFITVTVNPQSPRAGSAEARCGSVLAAAQSLAKDPDIVSHPYPVTPYHADYFAHVDLAERARAGVADRVTVRRSRSTHQLLSADTRTQVTDWDVEVGEVTIDQLLREARYGEGVWLPPAWVKEGWFQAYALLRPALSDPGRAQRADQIYALLRDANSGGEVEVERLNRERELVKSLTAGCEKAVIGFRLRREFYSDDFSNGVENIANDSQSGFNSGVVLRTLKLKDFPWNGWLRVGLDGRSEAAWNPVAGFKDAVGRLVWAMVGDAAYLPIPYNSDWVPNRTEVVPNAEPTGNQSMLIPTSALMPEPGVGTLAPVGPGKGAMVKLSYRVAASAFQDGTEMETADLLYPYALAFRWGQAQASATFDPEIAAATKRLRERLAGVRVVRVDQRSLQLADLTFTYRYPLVEVYLNAAARDAGDNALLAAPWSSVPWHVLALMEAAVERNVAAFSAAEAARRGLPWLDLVRDKAQLARLGALVGEFAKSGYRPAAVQALVSPEAATLRWQALAKFLEDNAHLLVTNGPYRLAKWSPQATVLAVMRDFSYPIGIGTFDRFAYPPHAVVTGIERQGDRVLVATDVEIAVKAQRDRRLVREPLKRETLRETLTIRPLARYLMVNDKQEVVQAGKAAWQDDGRFAAPLLSSPGRYRLLAGIFLDGNTIDPSIATIGVEGK
jgi:hypothetical protein